MPLDLELSRLSAFFESRGTQWKASGYFSASTARRNYYLAYRRQARPQHRQQRADNNCKWLEVGKKLERSRSHESRLTHF